MMLIVLLLYSRSHLQDYKECLPCYLAIDSSV